MSKKVISLALVVVMLFGMASMASAALGSGKKMGFTVTADKTTVEAGETVEIIVSVEVPGDDNVWGGGVVPLAYDKDAITEACVSGGSQLFGAAAYGVCLTFPAGYGATVDTANTCIDPVDFSSVTLRAEDEGKNWDAITAPAITNNGTNYTFTANTVEEIFRYTFTVSADAKDGDKIYVGIPAGAFDGDPPIGMMYSEAYGMEYWVDYDGDVYDFSEATVELTVGSAAPSVVVSHVKQQSKWFGGKADAANYLFGFVGQVSGLELTTTEKDGRAIVNEISAITATATINGQTVTSDVITVWAVDGGYQFRAQFAGFTPDMTYAAAVTFAVTMADGTTTYTSAEASAVINDIYTASVGNGLEALAA